MEERQELKREDDEMQLLSSGNKLKSVRFDNISELSYNMQEALRTLKTNVQFAGDDIKTILVTSTVADEGKTTLAFNLARSLTESGKRVLFIDADMRRSVVIGRMRAVSGDWKEILGLSHYLSGQKNIEEVVYETNIKNLCMIFSGPLVPNATELLEKRYFDRLISSSRNYFDYIIVDSAPLGATIDAAVISKQVDGAILVVAQGIVPTKHVLESKKQLETAKCKILGVVFNKVDVKRGEYKKYYGKYKKDYYGPKSKKKK